MYQVKYFLLTFFLLTYINLNYYFKGVYYEKNCPTAFDDLNHEVALVGYDKDYYILRNQWVNTIF